MAILSTPSAPSSDAASRLVGEHVRLWPYVRGYFPRHALYVLWQMMEAERAAPLLFYGRPGRADLPEATQGDLVDFIRCFEPQEGRRALLLVQGLRSGETEGMVWFDDFTPHRCAINMFYRRRAWGTVAREGSRLACGYAFENFGVKSIWGYSPFPLAVRHAEAIGFRILAVLPRYAWVNGKAQDMSVGCLTRDEYELR
ncbi:MAG: GNAT family N-acetyltransferase [Betaproteobacteria bacterium]|nr:GNAT family N-acetyltransferase [Betaproteobacteria bacterium]